MKSEKQVIADYIAQIESTRRLSGTLTKADLNNIAVELGINEVQLKRLKRIATDHLIRGEGHLDRNRIDEAITELGQAASLSPLSAPPTLALAQAHAARWRKEARSADRTRATVLARRSLVLESTPTEVYALLRSLKPPEEPKGRIARDFITILLVVLLGGGTLLGLSLRTDTEIEAGGTSPSFSTSREGSKPPIMSVLPITVIPYEPLPGLTLEVPKRDLEVFEESTTLKLGSIMVNGSGETLKKATVELLLLDEDDTPIYRHSIDILQTHHARVRSDDRHAFSNLTSLSMLSGNDASPKRGELRFVSVETMPVESSEPEITTQLLHWEVTKPPGVALSLERRLSPRSLVSLFHREEYAFSSLPESSSIERLKLRIDYLGDNDVVISSDESYVITTAEPELAPGEERLFCFLEPLRKAPEATRITVIEIQ